MKNHFLSCTAKQESVGFGFISHCICALLTSLKSVSQKCEARGLIFPLSYIHVNLKHSFVGVDNGRNAECQNFVFFVQEEWIVSQSNVLSLEEAVSQTMAPNYTEFQRAAVHGQVTGSGLMAWLCSARGLWGRGSIHCRSQPFCMVPSGRSHSLAWPFKEPAFSSAGTCWYFHLLLWQQKTTSIYVKVLFIYTLNFH